ncbi:MAG: sulfate ABC transporter ATP-binding protein, partial [Chthoniobacterales bacterium]|nr:sulfate ABC transporter ATP-binding protein [Chthoniobacterales bacterium]
MKIEVQRIYKKFGRFPALHDVNLTVPSGKLVALLGPSGSGKTTLLRIIAGLEFPDSGRIKFDDKEVTDMPAGKRQVGFVFQHYALFRHLTVFRNITFGLDVRPRRLRPSRTAAAKRVAELLKLVQLEGLENRFPPQLSGGQRQRIALARALAVEPKVLLLDEPFGALDAKVRKDLRRWLRVFQEEIGITTIFVTHDQEEALELADEVVVLNEGRIEQIGAPQHVYDKPSSPFVIEFLGNVNRFKAGVDPAASPESGVLYVRPHDVSIETGSQPSDQYALQAKVQHIFSAGNYARIALERTGTHEPFEAEIS